MKVLFFILALISIISIPRVYGLHCIDEHGEPVDWWVISKLPYEKGNKESKDGFGYAYVDANASSMKIAPHRLDTHLNGSLGSTLKQIYTTRKGQGYLMWNDHSPSNITPSSKAHAKGVMGFDANQGFFLRHSVPRFPNDMKDGYHGFPAYAKLYGQSFICISLRINEISTLAKQFLVNEPYVYDSHVPEEIASQFPNIKDLADGKKLSDSQSIVSVKSKGGFQFVDVAKSKTCNCDLFDVIIPNAVRENMRILTWGRPYMPSKCKPEHDYNIENISEISWGPLTYSSNKEHSKWGYSTSSDVVCIGDINRMESQRKRGGGATCFKSPVVSRTYKSITKTVESC